MNYQALCPSKDKSEKKNMVSSAAILLGTLRVNKYNYALVIGKDAKYYPYICMPQSQLSSCKYN